MPKRPKSAVKPPRVPSYCLHKATGQAYIKIRGRMVYLGLHGSPSSRDAYAAAVADLLAGRELTLPAADRDAEPEVDNRLTVAQLCQKYCRFAEGYYVKNGRPTGEAKTVAGACDHAVALFGEQPAESFGPLALKTVRERLVAGGLARTTVNGTIGRIRRAFTWGAGEELIPASVPVALGMVAGLRAGRSAAREPVPVRPVADAVVDATLPHLPVVVADMVRLQRLTGMRPGELCELRPCDLDRSQDIWTYRPASHKTEHHGRDRVVFLGAQSQAILLMYLARSARSRCFRPVDSEAKRRAALTAARVTPLSCGDRPGTNRKDQPLRSPGECYNAASLRRAIHRACDKAGVERWAPNQLRHAAATEVRAKFGLEAAQTILGHSTARMSEHYAEQNLAAGAEVARAIG